MCESSSALAAPPPSPRFLLLIEGVEVKVDGYLSCFTFFFLPYHIYFIDLICFTYYYLSIYFVYLFLHLFLSIHLFCLSIFFVYSYLFTYFVYLFLLLFLSLHLFRLSVSSSTLLVLRFSHLHIFPIRCLSCFPVYSPFPLLFIFYFLSFFHSTFSHLYLSHVLPIIFLSVVYPVFLFILRFLYCSFNIFYLFFTIHLFTFSFISCILPVFIFPLPSVCSFILLYFFVRLSPFPSLSLPFF